MGDVRFLAPVDSATSAFQTMLHDMGISYSRIHTSLTTAFAHMGTYKYDTLVVMPGGHSSGTAMLTWSKNYTNIVGYAAPLQFGGRCRITLTEADVATAFTLSGRGTYLKNLNIQWGAGNASATTGFSVTYSGNCANLFENVAFEGPNSATEGAAAFKVLNFASGCQDIQLKNCYIGSFTAAANQSSGSLIYFAGDQARMRFENCTVVANSTADAVPIAFAGNFSSEGVAEFIRCYFTDSRVASTNTKVFTAPTAGNGRVAIIDCKSTGYTDWSTQATSFRVCSGAASAENGGIGIQVTV